MLIANELRLGNIIYGAALITPNDKHVHTVDFATLGIISGEVDMKALLMFDPISLTDEWLSKFGFKKTNDDGNVKRFEKEYIAVHGSAFGYSMYFNHSFVGSKKYVHELQNLHFILIGEELTC